MKYCPYCGASLLGGAVSFCPECGKALRGRGPDPRGVRRKQSGGQKMKIEQEKRRRPKNPMDENYDGYYNDVRPVDADQLEKQIDPDLAKRVVCVLAGAVGAIVLAVILMTVL